MTEQMKRSTRRKWKDAKGRKETDDDDEEKIVWEG
jgi:hypothetical protein